MKNSNQRAGYQLNAGQLWKLKDRFVLVVALELESLSVRFKFMTRDDELEAQTLTGDVETLGRYLMARKGRLINSKFQAPRSKEVPNTNIQLAGSVG